MADSHVAVPTKTPPKWANSLVKVLLRTPVLQRILGQGLMLLSFTGRKSGTEYAIPVSYARSGDHVLAVTKLFRVWWKNLADQPEVMVRLGGKNFAGRASAAPGNPSQYQVLHQYLADRPMDAKAYGVRRIDGQLVEDDVRELLPQVVLIDIELQTG